MLKPEEKACFGNRLSYEARGKRVTAAAPRHICTVTAYPRHLTKTRGR